MNTSISNTRRTNERSPDSSPVLLGSIDFFIIKFMNWTYIPNKLQGLRE